ncbi:MAG: DUF2764 family protein [Planctomycetota bacterium]
MSYYYLVASLPAIVPGAAPPMSPASFRVLCSEHLEPRHLHELDAVLAGGGTSDFARQWQRQQTTLAHLCARERAARYGVDAASLPAPLGVPDLALVRAAQDALAATDPKARELALDALRLATLDHLAFATPFELGAVLAYALRLQIAARWAERTEATGRAELGRHVDVLLQQFDRKGMGS